jgi:hypothetical protein
MLKRNLHIVGCCLILGWAYSAYAWNIPAFHLLLLAGIVLIIIQMVNDKKNG